MESVHSDSTNDKAPISDILLKLPLFPLVDKFGYVDHENT